MVESFTVTDSPRIAPAIPALQKTIVDPVTVMLPEWYINSAPPSPMAVQLDIVDLMTANSPEYRESAPPLPVFLQSNTVESTRVTFPENIEIAPPLPVFIHSDMVESTRVTFPE
jgi:hypothetical protein